MKKNWLYYIVLMLAMLGCSHDLEEQVVDGEVAVVRLSLQPEIDMENMDDGIAARSLGYDLYDFRYTLEVWDSESGERVYREVRKGSLEQEMEVILELPQGMYDVLVWGDWVYKASLSNTYYDVDTLTRVRVRGEMYSDGRDAFAGKQSIKLGSGEEYSGEILLKRVVAKVVVKTTDEDLSPAGMVFFDCCYLTDVCTEYNVKTGESKMSCVKLQYPGYDGGYEVYDKDRNMIIFSDYLFVGEVDRVSIGIHFGFLPEGIPSRDVVIRNIPLKANRLIELKGSFLTDEGMMDIDLNEVK